MFPDSSRTTLRKMMQTGRVLVNTEMEKDARRELRRGDVVEVGPKASLLQLPLGLAMLHEDADVIVVVKSNGLLTVATEREKTETAQAYLNVYLKEKGEERIHVVHRLDRESSGVLVFAKSLEAREALKDQFAEHTTERVYVAIIEGAIEPPKATIRSYLAEDRSLKMGSVENDKDAKFAVTHYTTLDTGSRFSMLRVTLETGRKNQIRAHLSEKGHPIVGDQLYGSTTNPIGRLGLHARVLGFHHPRTGEKMTFTAEIPKAFRELKL
jgi:23S rRNA pseudouridine1911/1915/1917 synthase